MSVDAAKFADRLANLTLIGQRAARDGSAAFEKQHGIACAFDFVGGETFQNLNERYWRAVEDFKNENGFKPGSFINAPKIVALTMYCVLTHPENLFRSKVEGMDPSFFEYCYMSFCNLLMLSFLELDKADLGERRNMYYFVVRTLGTTVVRDCQPTQYALCLYMAALLIGKKQPNILD